MPHVRDALRRAGHRAALLPAQIIVAASLIAAVSEAMRGGDFLLSSAGQAAELGLGWRPLAAAFATRGYSVSAVTSTDAEHVRADLGSQMAQILGAAS